MNELKFLYLVNCLKVGEAYWKIGITNHTNPLNESKYFLECYRKELIGSVAANQILDAISINIKGLLDDCLNEGFSIKEPSDGISYDIPLVVVEEIFDFWFDLYKKGDLFDKVLELSKVRQRINLSNPFISKGLKGFTAEWVQKLEILYAFRPNSVKISSKKEPMWSDN